MPALTGTGDTLKIPKIAFSEIPEPATMMLFVLGGILIRRR
jgi:hypothetical protein